MAVSNIAGAIAAAAVVAAVAPAASRAYPAPLRVCADPNNLPFSRSDGSGFENRIAELVGRELGRPVVYTWWAQRRGFIRNTLNAGLCDLVVGVPAHHFDMAARTPPYYRSTYVFVTRAGDHLDLSTLDDPRLRSLRIGVHLIGDDGANTPPAHALGQLGIVTNVTGFPIYGDYSADSPPQRLIEAVARGDIDVALAWGPMAGPAARASAVPLAVTPIEETEQFRPLQFSFEIAMGVRKDDLALRRALRALLARRGAEIRALLEGAGVPLEPLEHPFVENASEPGVGEP